jgi:6-phosphofructokinase
MKGVYGIVASGCEASGMHEVELGVVPHALGLEWGIIGARTGSFGVRG